MGAAVSKPDIFKFDSFREFLRAHTDFLKAQSNDSLRALAKEAGFRSPNYISLIISGKRNLSLESADRLCSLLGLDPAEARFFIELIRFNQSKTPTERRRHRLGLLKSKRFEKAVPIRSKSVSYYSNWYYIAIRELVALKDFREEPAWIAHKLGNVITATEAAKAIEDLLALGLLLRGHDGRLQQLDKTVTADDSITASALKDFHAVMIGKAQDALENLSSKERDVSAITIPVNAELVAEMRMMVTEFRRKLLAMSAACKDADNVVQINLQLFPLTKPAPGGQDEP